MTKQGELIKEHLENMNNIISFKLCEDDFD